MDEQRQLLEPLAYQDDIPDPEEEAPPRDDEADALLHAARRRLVPSDEHVPQECFDERLL